MRRFLFEILFALLFFAIGVGSGVRWQAHRNPLQTPPSDEQELDQEQLPLTKEIVSRSLQTHIFRTDKLRRNSDPEIVWRWLKETLTTYRQNWVKLNISDDESYGVALYPQKTLDAATLAIYNRELSELGMPLLHEDKRYLPIQINQSNMLCPNWQGLVDFEEARLVYFVGLSG
jgi:hypothetical protein